MKRAPLTPVNLPTDWAKALEDDFSSDYFYELKDFLIEERKKYNVYPPSVDVFNALRLTPLENVKILILGQDPYHGAGQAHGLSFSVLPDVRIPPSLRNIYKELQSDVPEVIVPKHGYLESWAKQGVLMLNAVMTVREGEANSHKDKGWEKLTDSIIRTVNNKPERVVFILWGAYARKKIQLITNEQHVIIQSAHPSPFSERMFSGSRPFSRANAALLESGLECIDWQLPQEI